MAAIKGKTKSGFKYEIPEERASNYELIECMAEVDENPLLLPKTIKLLLGEDAAASLKDHVRDENGFVPSERIGEEIAEMFAYREVKNS